jgi:hypothetical protein
MCESSNGLESTCRNESLFRSLLSLDMLELNFVWFVAPADRIPSNDPRASDLLLEYPRRSQYLCNFCLADNSLATLLKVFCSSLLRRYRIQEITRLLCDSVSFTLQRLFNRLGRVVQDRSEIGYWYSDHFVGSLDGGLECEIPRFIVVQAVCRKCEPNNGGQRTWGRD